MFRTFAKFLTTARTAPETWFSFTLSDLTAVLELAWDRRAIRPIIWNLGDPFRSK